MEATRKPPPDAPGSLGCASLDRGYNPVAEAGPSASGDWGYLPAGGEPLHACARSASIHAWDLEPLRRPDCSPGRGFASPGRAPQDIRYGEQDHAAA
jgi:hypothetical protein